MITIDNQNYFNKVEIAQRLGCCSATINKRIAAAHVEGLYFGKTKYYTEAQIKAIATARTSAK